jgi:hypothetical protein
MVLEPGALTRARIAVIEIAIALNVRAVTRGEPWPLQRGHCTRTKRDAN